MGKGNFFEKKVLETSGTRGYDMYRVPGIVVTGSGTVLAYYDARRTAEPCVKQDLILCRSCDGGVSFPERTILVNGRQNENIHNAVMIAENQGDTVHFFYNVNHNKCYYMKSEDSGNTWGEKRDLTSVFEGFRSEYPWDVFSVGPGHGIELSDGTLFLQAWLSTGGNTHRPSVVTGILSHDRGGTWEQCGILHNSESFLNPNETAVCELNNGSILFNMRHDTPIRRRAVAISHDGGKHWDTPRFELDLPDPVCCAGIARVPDLVRGKDSFVFSNCAWEDISGLKSFFEGGKRWSDDARRNLTVRLSTDDCATWPYARHIEEQSGYSDIYPSRDGKTIYCIYEKEWIDGQCIFPKSMAFARFDIEYIKNGRV